MMGLGKGNSLQNMAIFGINSLDFWGVILILFSQRWNTQKKTTRIFQGPSFIGRISLLLWRSPLVIRSHSFIRMICEFHPLFLFETQLMVMKVSRKGCFLTHR